MAALIDLEQPLISTFDRWWHSPGEWVEPANQRRGGESGVRLLTLKDSARPELYCKQQSGHIYRTLLHPFGRPTILREQRAYRAFAHLGINTPKLIYCAARKLQGRWEALLITESLAGFISLDQWYTNNEGSELSGTVMQELARVLARLHLSGWQHGCCYPKHIFVKAWTDEAHAMHVEIALLDLEKSRRRLRAKSASEHDLSQFERHLGMIPKTELLKLQKTYSLVMNRGQKGTHRSVPAQEQ